MNAEPAFPDPPDLSKIKEDEHYDAICAHQEEISEMLGLGCVWSAGGQGTLTSKAMLNPTWVDLWQAADSVIEASGDTHHIFVESFDIDGEGFLRLSTGS